MTDQVYANCTTQISGFAMPVCTCLGTNPNCFKCGGWGWLGDDVAKHRGGDRELAPSLPNYSQKTTTRPVSPIAKPQKTKTRQVAPIAKPQKTKTRQVAPIAKRTIQLTTKRGMVQCEICGAMVREDRITGHRYRVHNDGIPASTAKPAPTRQLFVFQIDAESVDLTEEYENSAQPSYETRFGDKYLGYPAREEGRYGSISLYDDYGDESSPE